MMAFPEINFLKFAHGYYRRRKRMDCLKNAPLNDTVPPLQEEKASTGKLSTKRDGYLQNLLSQNLKTN